MYVPFDNLKPNPYRDMTVDPIDEDAVQALVQSIEEDGFWGGVVISETEDGEHIIAAGHHRIEAARRCGINGADVFVAQLDPEALVRIYARENALQRGNNSTAAVGSVAAALRVAVRKIVAENSGATHEIMNGGAISRDGIGAPRPSTPSLERPKPSTQSSNTSPH